VDSDEFDEATEDEEMRMQHVPKEEEMRMQHAPKDEDLPMEKDPKQNDESVKFGRPYFEGS
jgi:hypothetical protein